MTPSEWRRRVEGLAKRARKGAAVLEEMALEAEALLEDKGTPGQQAKQLLDEYAERWADRYGAKLHVDGAKDMAALKRLLKTFDVDEVRARMGAFFAARDRFYVEAKHPLAMFVKVINKLGASDQGLEFDAPKATGCRHDPPCNDDVEHTRRKMREARA